MSDWQLSNSSWSTDSWRISLHYSVINAVHWELWVGALHRGVSQDLQQEQRQEQEQPQ